GRRTPITDVEVMDVIDWLQEVAAAILAVIGPPPLAPSTAGGQAKPKWSRQDIDEVVAKIADTPVGVAARSLLAHADANNALFKGGGGVQPAAGLYYWLDGKRRSLWQLYLWERPVMSVNLNGLWTWDRDLAFHVLGVLRAESVLDAALRLPDEELVRKYPEFGLAELGGAPEALETVLRALDLAIKWGGPDEGR
ncbi:hypothetical protein K7G98_23500, partial [Saccharothrix sp. MB29]|nr:hypothetical protein [Saccharothrix sp. MB29]